MVTTLGWLYLVAGTVLFFFWAYGIVSFVRDVRRRYLPAVRRYRERRSEREAAEAQEREEEDRRRQLL